MIPLGPMMPPGLAPQAPMAPAFRGMNMYGPSRGSGMGGGQQGYSPLSRFAGSLSRPTGISAIAQAAMSKPGYQNPYVRREAMFGQRPFVTDPGQTGAPSGLGIGVNPNFQPDNPYYQSGQYGADKQNWMAQHGAPQMGGNFMAILQQLFGGGGGGGFGGFGSSPFTGFQMPTGGIPQLPPSMMPGMEGGFTGVGGPNHWAGALGGGGQKKTPNGFGLGAGGAGSLSPISLNALLGGG